MSTPFERIQEAVRELNASPNPADFSAWSGLRIVSIKLSDMGDLLNEVTGLRQQVAGLEKLRPVWALGYSSESVAAQSTAAALSQLWAMLGVSDQTGAVFELRNIQTFIVAFDALHAYRDEHPECDGHPDFDMDDDEDSEPSELGRDQELVIAMMEARSALKEDLDGNR